MPSNTYDIVINNARIIEGAGGPERTGSVGIRNGLIAEVRLDTDPQDALTGEETIDVGGQVLSPGFIDLHSHADFSLEANPDAVTQITQGVTTLLAGNCGTSPFPINDVRALEAATSFLRPALDWSWTDASGFAKTVQRSSPAVNLGLQVGHGALRIAAMGDSAREPSAEELANMCRMLRQSAEQGVRGFSTGLIYAPGAYANTSEVEALARIAAECGLVYSTHMRNETDDVLEAVAEALSVARRSGVRLEISHIKAMGPQNHGKVRTALKMMADARAEGVDVTADVYPYSASSTTLTSRLPGWALDGGAPALLHRLADREHRQQLSAALAARFEGEIDPAGIVIADLPPGKYTDWVGHSLVEIADAYESTPHEVALDVLATHNAAVAIVNHAMNETDIEEALHDPHISVASDGWVMTATGDGNPHPRSFGTFSRFLGEYVRNRGLLPLEEAIRKITSLPAARAGLSDRGIIAPGYAADIAVFDPATIKDRATYADPWQLSFGVAHVLVNGQFVVRDHEPTAARPGRIV